MIKFMESLFLKSFWDVDKLDVYGKYWNFLIDSDDFDLVSKFSKDSKYTSEDMDKAVKNAYGLNEILLNGRKVHVITMFNGNYLKKLMLIENKRRLILYLKCNVDLLTKSNIPYMGIGKLSDESDDLITSKKTLIKQTIV